MKILEKHTTYYKQVEEMTIEIAKNKKIIIEKCNIDADWEHDCDYQVLQGKEIYDNLTDNQQDKISGLIWGTEV